MLTSIYSAVGSIHTDFLFLNSVLLLKQMWCFLIHLLFFQQRIHAMVLSSPRSPVTVSFLWAMMISRFLWTAKQKGTHLHITSKWLFSGADRWGSTWCNYHVCFCLLSFLPKARLLNSFCLQVESWQQRHQHSLGSKLQSHRGEPVDQ